MKMYLRDILTSVCTIPYLCKRCHHPVLGTCLTQTKLCCRDCFIHRWFAYRFRSFDIQHLQRPLFAASYSFQIMPTSLLIFLLLSAPLLAISFLKGFTFVRNAQIPISLREYQGVLSASSTSTGDFAQSFVAQKNFILLDKLENPPNGNTTEAACQYVNFCDESFDAFLSERIASLPNEKDKQYFGKIRFAVNSARQQKLMEADKILRGILAAGGLKQMEAKLYYHLKRVEIDMAFMVLLNLNIEDAVVANVTTAVQVMTHLRTIINEQQDAMVSAPVRLLRLLVRTDDSNVRKQMLRQKVIVPGIIGIGTEIKSSTQSEKSDETTAVEGAQSTLSPQCEHIVVSAVQSWGGADVSVKELEDTVTDVLSQVSIIRLCYTAIQFIVGQE